MEQRSAEWFSARLGKVTASMVDVVISGSKLAKEKYFYQLITERLTNKVTPMYVTTAMQHGIDYEDEARIEYANFNKLLLDKDVREVGFIDHPSISMSGASPDGLVHKDGLIEIKCVQPITHTTTLATEIINKKYINQMQWQMACTGKQWCDFVSYQPSFPKAYKLFIKRVERDDDYIDRLEVSVGNFLKEVEDKLKTIKEKLNETS